MGPFELMDLIGVDVNLAAARGIYEGFARAAIRWPIGSGRRRSRSGWSRRAGSAARPGDGFYAYDGGPVGEVRAAVPPPARRLQTRPPATDRRADRAGDRERGVPGPRRGRRIARTTSIVRCGSGAGHPTGPFERWADRGGRNGDPATSARQRSAAPTGRRFDPAPGPKRRSRVGSGHRVVTSRSTPSARRGSS